MIFFFFWLSEVKRRDEWQLLDAGFSVDAVALGVLLLKEK